MKEFSEILRELRTSNNLSQEGLGQIVHVSRSSIAKYENGLGLPSEEVIQALCDYFKVNKDYLFPKEHVESLITEKNIIINKQKKRLFFITLFLSLLVITLLIFISILNIDNENGEEVKLEDIEEIVNLNNVEHFHQQIHLFKYDGGYVYQTLEIKEINFTSTTNLYLIRVHNTYTNGHTAFSNGDQEFNKDEYTEKVYMGIDFTISSNFVPIVSWHQKHSTSFSIQSWLNPEGTILLNENTSLFDDANIKKYDDNFIFSYNGRITEWLFDYEYNEILRKCTINNGDYNSNWEYEMINEMSKIQSFTIASSYLIEAEEGQLIEFNIDTKMNNTNMSIQQLKRVKLYT